MNELNVILKEATEEELIAILDFIEKEKTAQIIAEEIFKAGKDSDPRLITQIVREVFGELIYKYASSPVSYNIIELLAYWFGENIEDSSFKFEGEFYRQSERYIEDLKEVVTDIKDRQYAYSADEANQLEQDTVKFHADVEAKNKEGVQEFVDKYVAQESATTLEEALKKVDVQAYAKRRKDELTKNYAKQGMDTEDPALQKKIDDQVQTEAEGFAKKHLTPVKVKDKYQTGYKNYSSKNAALAQQLNTENAEALVIILKEIKANIEQRIEDMGEQIASTDVFNTASIGGVFVKTKGSKGPGGFTKSVGKAKSFGGGGTDIVVGLQHQLDDAKDNLERYQELSDKQVGKEEAYSKEIQDLAKEYNSIEENKKNAYTDLMATTDKLYKAVEDKAKKEATVQKQTAQQVATLRAKQEQAEQAKAQQAQNQIAQQATQKMEEIVTPAEVAPEPPKQKQEYIAPFASSIWEGVLESWPKPKKPATPKKPAPGQAPGRSIGQRPIEPLLTGEFSVEDMAAVAASRDFFMKVSAEIGKLQQQLDYFDNLYGLSPEDTTIAKTEKSKVEASLNESTAIYNSWLSLRSKQTDYSNFANRLKEISSDIETIREDWHNTAEVEKSVSFYNRVVKKSETALQAVEEELHQEKFVLEIINMILSTESQGVIPQDKIEQVRQLLGAIKNLSYESGRALSAVAKNDYNQYLLADKPEETDASESVAEEETPELPGIDISSWDGINQLSASLLKRLDKYKGKLDKKLDAEEEILMFLEDRYSTITTAYATVKDDIKNGLDTVTKDIFGEEAPKKKKKNKKDEEAEQPLSQKFTTKQERLDALEELRRIKDKFIYRSDVLSTFREQLEKAKNFDYNSVKRSVWVDHAKDSTTATIVEAVAWALDNLSKYMNVVSKNEIISKGLESYAIYPETLTDAFEELKKVGAYDKEAVVSNSAENPQGNKLVKDLIKKLKSIPDDVKQNLLLKDTPATSLNEQERGSRFELIKFLEYARNKIEQNNEKALNSRIRGGEVIVNAIDSLLNVKGTLPDTKKIYDLLQGTLPGAKEGEQAPKISGGVAAFLQIPEVKNYVSVLTTETKILDTKIDGTVNKEIRKNILNPIKKFRKAVLDAINLGKKAGSSARKTLYGEYGAIFDLNDNKEKIKARLKVNQRLKKDYEGSKGEAKELSEANRNAEITKLNKLIEDDTAEIQLTEEQLKTETEKYEAKGEPFELSQIIDRILFPQKQYISERIGDKRIDPEFLEKTTYQNVLEGVKPGEEKKVAPGKVRSGRENWYTFLRQWKGILDQCIRHIREASATSNETKEYTPKETDLAPEFKEGPDGAIGKELVDVTNELRKAISAQDKPLREELSEKLKQLESIKQKIQERNRILSRKVNELSSLPESSRTSESEKVSRRLKRIDRELHPRELVPKQNLQLALAIQKLEVLGDKRTKEEDELLQGLKEKQKAESMAKAQESKQLKQLSKADNKFLDSIIYTPEELKLRDEAIDKWGRGKFGENVKQLEEYSYKLQRGLKATEELYREKTEPVWALNKDISAKKLELDALQKELADFQAPGTQVLSKKDFAMKKKELEAKQIKISGEITKLENKRDQVGSSIREEQKILKDRTNTIRDLLFKLHYDPKGLKENELKEVENVVKTINKEEVAKAELYRNVTKGTKGKKEKGVGSAKWLEEEVTDFIGVLSQYSPDSVKPFQDKFNEYLQAKESASSASMEESTATDIKKRLKELQQKKEEIGRLASKRVGKDVGDLPPEELAKTEKELLVPEAKKSLSNKGYDVWLLDKPENKLDDFNKKQKINVQNALVKEIDRVFLESKKEFADLTEKMSKVKEKGELDKLNAESKARLNSIFDEILKFPVDTISNRAGAEQIVLIQDTIKHYRSTGEGGPIKVASLLNSLPSLKI